MIDIPFIAVLIALAVLALLVFFLAPTSRGHKRQRPEQWEKAAIMQRLFAASERETNPPATPSSVRLRASGAGSVPMKTTAKTSLPIRAKTS